MIASFMLLLASEMQQAPPIPPMPNLSPCAFERPARLVERKDALPAEAIQELDRLFRSNKGIAEAGAYFEASDSIQIPDAPRSRFLRAYLVGDTWFIWFETGGIGLSRQVVALQPRRRDDGVVQLYAVPGSLFSGDLCAAGKAFLAGVRS
ncbi:MAG: hypothetical protein J7500_03525 [Sphingomonas sp.]|uniref:hypothetical protein n=1 Tax=Sphingomonas sp. TaxID=28214 RepID=UPI001B2086B7|nr:hypothetical protein [Sphingomonas sp.]MBO9621762.1 hypothetical protein [Sphingomonas sp.]